MVLEIKNPEKCTNLKMGPQKQDKIDLNDTENNLLPIPISQKQAV